MLDNTSNGYSDNNTYRTTTKAKGYVFDRDGTVIRVGYEKKTKNGHIRRKSDMVVEQTLNKDGKLSVNINGKSVLLHRLMALAWLGNPRNRDVGFKDGNKSNCAVENLEYISRTRTNIKIYEEKGYIKGKNGLDTSKVDIIRARARGGYANIEIAEYLNVSDATVSRVLNKSRWGWHPDNGAIEYRPANNEEDVIVIADVNVNNNKNIWDDGEVWVDIDEHKGRYQVSSEGKVQSLPRITISVNGQAKEYKGGILKQTIQNGEPKVSIHGKGKGVSRKVSRLVAQAFRGADEKGGYILHLDNDKTNNRASNIWYSADYDEYVVKKREIGAIKSKLGDDVDEIVNKILAMYNKGIPVVDIAEQCGVSAGYVYTIMSGKAFGGKNKK